VTPVPRGYVLDADGVLWHRTKAPRTPRPTPQVDPQAARRRAKAMQAAVGSQRPSCWDNSRAAQSYRLHELAEAVAEYTPVQKRRAA
jgi:hypothetical protein